MTNLLTPTQLAEIAKRESPDCGDNSCRFAKKRGGMRTNGGCRCLDKRSIVSWNPVEKYAALSSQDIPALLSDRAELVRRLREAASVIKRLEPHRSYVEAAIAELLEGLE